jgi:catechol 2,3-dioxygenase
MSATTPKPRLSLSHSTLAARDLGALVTFYCKVLGFHETNRGPTPDGGEIAFLSQDPGQHHQIALVAGQSVPEAGFMMVDHLAFRTESLDDLRAIRASLRSAGVEPILPICHGNAWSLYFDDCEGNGVECFVDTPFHVAQPFATGFDLDQPDADLAEWTRGQVESQPEFQPLSTWRKVFAEKLGAARASK